MTDHVGTQQLLSPYCHTVNLCHVSRVLKSAEQRKEHDMHDISYDRLCVQMTHRCFPMMHFMQQCEPSVTVTATG